MVKTTVPRILVAGSGPQAGKSLAVLGLLVALRKQGCYGLGLACFRAPSFLQSVQQRAEDASGRGRVRATDMFAVASSGTMSEAAAVQG